MSVYATNKLVEPDILLNFHLVVHSFNVSHGYVSTWIHDSWADWKRLLSEQVNITAHICIHLNGNLNITESRFRRHVKQKINDRRTDVYNKYQNKAYTYKLN